MSPAPPRPGPPYAAVALDCDSTLSYIEGIDELCADLAPDARAELLQLTEDAMSGRTPLEEVYGARLALARPSRADLALVADRYAARAMPGAAQLVAALRHLGKRVAVVSGGLEPAVAPFAARLGVDPAEVHAVGAQFDADGEWLGHDATSPLARAGGKLEVLRAAFPDGDVALVGDGATDAEAAPCCARFIAFAGVAARPAVLAQADAAVHAPDLAALLPLLLDEAELAALEAHPDHRALALRARAAAAPELWIPGPTRVRPELLDECSRPMIGHRSPEMRALLERLDGPLERAFGLEPGAASRAAVHSCTASGLMEAALRGAAREGRQARVLALVNGSFSRRFAEVAEGLGYEVTRALRAPGEGFRAADVRRALASGGPYDALTFVASETSTGAATPPTRVAEGARDHPEVLLLADVVTWLGAAPVDLDAHGLDAAVAGTQKALALPPGLGLMAVSGRYLERARAAPRRGWFLDPVRILEAHAAHAPPMTPTLSLYRALARQLEEIDGGALEAALSPGPRPAAGAAAWQARFARHARMSARTRARGAELGLRPVPSEDDASPTVACLDAGGRDPRELVRALEARGFRIGTGYGELAASTLRIGHMGDHTEARLEALLDALADVLADVLGEG